uniref:Uncharacterized protein n=1 Tax=Panagrolaimus superbus TaxID=310955 RepID=A0A914YKC9_9BILA
MAGSTAATPASVQFPHIPPFAHDPSDPTSATTWLRQVEIKYAFVPNLTEAHKVGLVAAVLDAETFKRVDRALLPEDITTLNG